MRVAMERVVAAGKPLTPATIRDELRKAGFMTDQERRAELEKLLATITAGTRSARKSNAIRNCLSSEQGEPGAAPRGDISPTPEVEPLNIPLEPSPFEREKVERQAAADEQRRQEHQRLMEQIEAVKAHGRHHARRLSIGNPSGSFHSGPRYATRDGLPIVRPGWRDFE